MSHTRIKTVSGSLKSGTGASSALRNRMRFHIEQQILTRVSILQIHSKRGEKRVESDARARMVRSLSRPGCDVMHMPTDTNVRVRTNILIRGRRLIQVDKNGKYEWVPEPSLSVKVCQNRNGQPAHRSTSHPALPNAILPQTTDPQNLAATVYMSFRPCKLC